MLFQFLLVAFGEDYLESKRALAARISLINERKFLPLFVF